MTPKARFLQINELHVQDPAIVRRHHAGSHERVAWLFEAIRQHHFGELDFILGLGDFVDGPSLDEIQADLAELQRLMGELPCPVRPVVGNHDISKQEGDLKWEAPFLEAFGLSTTSYEFRHAGLQFVMLNNAGTTNRDEATYQRRSAWLAETLSRLDGPILLCCHMPLVAMRDQATLIESCRFDTWRTQELDVLEVVQDHREKIAAIISGHLHLTSVQHVDGLIHIDIAGVASYPSDVALYEVFDSHIEVQVVQLPEELRVRETNIHGRPRHDQDFTDSEHPTFESYLMGNAKERQFRIPLTTGVSQ